METAPYQSRLAAEKAIYENVVDVHRLPDIFHYWSNRFLQPKLVPLGFRSPNGLFTKFAAEQCAGAGNRAVRFASIGSGNCDLEIELALQLRDRGFDRFTIDCIDVNPAMLQRGESAAAESGLARHLSFVTDDFNAWLPRYEYDAVIANQSLHHVTELEKLFDRVRDCLTPRGSFLISDIIGRNGHQRWPEALDLVHEFWRKLPPSYRINRSLGRYEELYRNWDCSFESFEGLRSQDILPLLLERFHFRLFFGFGNIIDPFVDRTFGPNFHADSRWDRDFIDEVHLRDKLEIESGNLTPTHMLAVVGKDPGAAPIASYPRSPEHSIRVTLDDVGEAAPSASMASSPYCWDSWPRSIQEEIEFVCRRLAATESLLAGRMSREAELYRQLHERSEWAIKRDRDFAERTEWALRLEEELRRTQEDFHCQRVKLERVIRERDDRSAWAIALNAEIEKCRARVVELQSEVEQRRAG